MSTLLNLPVALSIPSPDASWQVPVSIPVGQWFGFLGVPSGTSIDIHMYALCIIAGIVIAVLLTNRRLTRRGAEPWLVIDILIPALILGIVGARLWHVFTHPGDYFGDGRDPWEIVRVWNGGIAIFGALIGGAVGAWIGCRMTGLRFWAFADALAPGMLLAQATGRLGNWFNHEIFGLPTDLPWGLEIEATNPAFPVGLAPGTLFQPTFLYEIIWNVIGALLLLWISRRFLMQWGRLWALYMIWYGLGRLWLENLRIDPSEVILGLRSNVWGSILFIAIGVILYWVQTRRHPGLEPSVYAPGREPESDSGVDSDSVYTAAELEASADRTPVAAGDTTSPQATTQ